MVWIYYGGFMEFIEYGYCFVGHSLRLTSDFPTESKILINYF